MIICSAIKVQALNNEDVIICGYRHCDCLKSLYLLNPDLSKETRKNGTIEQGFLATGNRFLDRHSAFIHASECGQLSVSTKEFKESRGQKELYSEDLY